MISQTKTIISTVATEHKTNLFYFFSALSLFVILETLYRLATNKLSVFLPFNEYATLFALLLVISYCSRRFANMFLGYILILYFFQMANYNYFGYFIFPIEIFLFFAKTREIFDVVPTVLEMIIVPFLGVVAIWLTARYLDRKCHSRKNSHIASLVIIILLTFSTVNLAFTKQSNPLGSRPNDNKSILKNSIYLSEYFVGKTFLRMAFNIETVKSWSQPTFSVAAQHEQFQNVIFIVGESLTMNHVSLYGYPRQTMPKMEHYAKRHDFLFKPAISAGVWTDTAIPALLGVAKKPNATEYIIGGDNNLFRLAKEQGYHTYFISSQARNGFSYIRSYMSVNNIDRYIDASAKTGEEYISLNDEFLVEEFKKIPLTETNFIVLNMFGSHEPYKKRYPATFSKFGESSPVDQYDNSVYYTDYVISSIIDYLESTNNGKSVVIFTSDHGQHVGEDGYGKGNVEIPSDYEVPFFLLPLNAKRDEKVTQYLDQQWISHYNVSSVVAYYLGYNALQKNNIGEISMFVNGGELNGNAGYAELHLLPKGFERIYHYQ